MLLPSLGARAWHGELMGAARLKYRAYLWAYLNLGFRVWGLGLKLACCAKPRCFIHLMLF